MVLILLFVFKKRLIIISSKIYIAILLHNVLFYQPKLFSLLYININSLHFIRLWHINVLITFRSNGTGILFIYQGKLTASFRRKNICPMHAVGGSHTNFTFKRKLLQYLSEKKQKIPKSTLRNSFGISQKIYENTAS